ncbi:MAG: sulfurtransferase [Betaproteobacteria bacterium]|nr:sulfurtransferase [Betaproteobacteria bacterium]
MLISTEQLATHLNDPAWVVFDCRHDLMDLAKGERVYREGHIPGAHFAHLDTDLSGEKTGSNGRHPLPAPAAFVAFLARNGVGSATHIVAYDDAGGPYAARLWWLARWVGLRDVVLLDGGINKWLAEGRALSRDVPVSIPAPLRGQADPLMVMAAPELLARLNDSETTLIDARAPERYRGDVEPIDPVAGHIPGAMNHFFKDNLGADGTFLPQPALRERFHALMKSGSPQQVVHQCGSGVTACANLFAMELAGLAGSKLYAGSWSEWIADPARPVRKGAAA